jgi:hypothetical protein
MFREVFYAQARGDERRLNVIIRWMFRIRLERFSLVFFASHHLAVLFLLLFLHLKDDDLADCDDDFAF